MNLFERNPKKSLIIFLLIIFVSMLFLTEKLIPLKTGAHRNFTERFIRLSEHEINSVRFVMPDNAYMRGTDSLIQKKYLLRIDENGFIMPSKIHNKPDLTIVFLGESTTECVFVDEENRFPYLVGRLIEKSIGLNTNSYNSGVSGNNSLQSINILLNKVIPLKPDIVIICHNSNDLSPLLYEKSYWPDNPSRSTIVVSTPSMRGVLREIKNIMFPNLYGELNNIFHFNIVNKIKDEFTLKRRRKIIINEGGLIAEFQMNLQVLVDICKSRGITPVLMTQANRFTDNPDSIIMASTVNSSPSYSACKKIYDLFNQAIRETGRANNILVIDLAKKVPQDNRYMYDSAHFNDNGSRFAAHIIAEELKTSVLLEKHKKQSNLSANN